MNKHFTMPSLKLRLNEGDTLPDEVEILRVGNYDHPYYGKFEISHAHLDSFVTNFHNNVRRIDLAVDYDHETREAAGWFKDVVKRENSVWGVIDWTPNGAKSLTDKEFRYISADFDMNYIDNESKTEYGPTLYGAALTNRPFVKGMAPTVELKENTNGGNSMNLEELKKENEKLLSEKTTALKELETLKVELSDIKKINETMSKEVEDLKAENVRLSEEQKLSKKEAEFEKMLSEGKAVPAQKEAFLKGDLDAFISLSQSVNFKESGTGEDPPVTGDDDKANIEAARKLSEEKGIPLHDAISEVLRSKKS